MLDKFTKAYLDIISEGWYNYNPQQPYFRNNYKKRSYQPREIVQFSVTDVAYAMSITTNDFKGEWVKGETGKLLYNDVKKIYDARQKLESGETSKENLDDGFDIESSEKTSEELVKEADEKGPAILQEAFEYWENVPADDDFAKQCKEMFNSFICPSDKLGILGYAIWQGVTATRFKKSVGDDFQVGNKVDLTSLKYETNYSSEGFYGGYTTHYTFSSDKYPNIVFDVVFGKNAFTGTEYSSPRGSRGLNPGDIFDIEAKVKNIYSKKHTIYLNYGKVKFVKFKETPKETKQNLVEAPKGTRQEKALSGIAKVEELAQPLFDKICNDPDVDIKANPNSVGWLKALLRLDMSNADNFQYLNDSVKNILVGQFKNEMNHEAPGLSKYTQEASDFYDKYNKIYDEAGF